MQPKQADVTTVGSFLTLTYFQLGLIEQPEEQQSDSCLENVAGDKFCPGKAVGIPSETVLAFL